jgi:succinate-semialdehyde dehydrogenase/glutarate-semialdehyde dehydrogenase
VPLQCEELLREQAWLDGRWVDADSGETFAVTNPARGGARARAAHGRRRDARRARGGRPGALPSWRDRTADRARILRRWADLMLEHLDDLALLLTLEQGKPLPESEAEIRYAASFLEWFGEEGKRVHGDAIPSLLPGRRILVLKQPVGVSAGITPRNFLSAMVTARRRLRWPPAARWC